MLLFKIKHLLYLLSLGKYNISETQYKLLSLISNKTTNLFRYVVHLILVCIVFVKLKIKHDKHSCMNMFS